MLLLLCVCPQKELGVRQQEVQQQVLQREKKLKEVQQAVEALNVSGERLGVYTTKSSWN